MFPIKIFHPHSNSDPETQTATLKECQVAVLIHGDLGAIRTHGLPLNEK